MWKTIYVFIIQAEALSGENAGFRFPAVGLQTVDESLGNTYGGMTLGYSATSVRVFLPSGIDGYIINVDEQWGNATNAQHSKDAVITIVILDPLGMGEKPSFLPYTLHPYAIMN